VEFAPDSLLRANSDLLHELRRCEQQVSHLAKALDATKGNSDQALSSLAEPTAQIRHTIAVKLKELDKIGARLKQELGSREARAALDQIRQHALPQSGTSALVDENVQKAVRALQARQPERELVPLVNAVSEPVLQSAIELAEDNVQVIEGSNKPVSRALDQLGALVREQASVARSVLRPLSDIGVKTAELQPGQDKRVADVRLASAELNVSAETIRTIVARLSADFMAAEDSYTALRYEQEARANEQAAGLYEVQVRKSGFTSERHRARSKNFFYGMLAAQAGVTVASFSLAVRHRNLLWSLATLAGLGAVIFGLYVYVYM
jgi:hypothetical protein